MDDWAIHCSDVCKEFGSVVAVDRMNLRLAQGRLLALLGPSGCGKTSALRLIAGFDIPDAGTISIGGRTVVDSGVYVPPEKRRIGMVFQSYALFPHLDVEQNVVYGLGKAKDRAVRVEEMLSLVGLSGLGKRMPHELSGGQQQRVALARALAPSPDVLLLDEPFSNLDAGLRARVRGEVREILRSAGATAVFVTHDQEEALSLADEVAVMMSGRILQTGSPEEVYWRPASRTVAAFVGEANFLVGEASGGTALCELGSLPAIGSRCGDVELMLRPETIVPVPDPSGPGLVTLREFFGRDQLVTVLLGSGARLRCRLGPEPAPNPGQRVRLEVLRPALAYPSCLPH